MQAIGVSLAGQGDGVEERGFEEQVAGAVADAAVLAAHHPGDGQGALVVGDHQGVGAQGDFLAVEQDQLAVSAMRTRTPPLISARSKACIGWPSSIIT